MNRYPHVAARLFGPPLLVEPLRLKGMLEGLAPRLLAPKVMDDDDAPGGRDGAPNDGFLAEKKKEVERRRLAVLAGGGQVVPVGDVAEYVVTREGIAILPIVGALVQRFDWLSALCGLVSYEAIAAMLDDAAANPSVRGILLDVDSPGGEATGCFDCADRIYAARDAKPLWAVANCLAASGGYALASAASRLFLPQVAFVGSVGCAMVHVDRSGQDAELGLDYTPIYSGARKIDGWDHAPLDPGASAAFQTEVDTIRDVFAAQVARNRDLEVEAVLATEAAIFMGDAAVEVGFADDVAAFDEVLARFAEQVTSPRGSLRVQSSSSERTIMHNRRATAGSGKPKTEEMKPADEKPGDGTDTKPAEGAEAAKPAEGAKDAGGGDKPAEKPSSEKSGGEGAKPADAGAQAARADARAIVDLCTLAGEPTAVAAELIGKGLSVEDARRHLAERRNARIAAEAGADELHNKHAPSRGAATIDTSDVYARWNARKR